MTVARARQGKQVGVSFAEKTINNEWKTIFRLGLRKISLQTLLEFVMSPARMANNALLEFWQN
jgi:hypothetical protein